MDGHRVLGQYDLLVIEDEPEDQDLVYYVGPNVLALERYAFRPRSSACGWPSR